MLNWMIKWQGSITAKKRIYFFHGVQCAFMLWCTCVSMRVSLFIMFGEEMQKYFLTLPRKALAVC